MERTPSILLLVASLSACTSQASDSGPGQDVLEGKLSNNGLVLNHEHLDLLSIEALAVRVGDEILLNEEAFAPLLAEAGGDELLAYLATCALSEDQSMTVASSGQNFSGNLGLAPQWIGDSCDHSCQRWISSCLLAHANAFDTAVPISPRGANPGLRWGDEIAREFGHLEAAYYGNIFLPEGERIMSACSGEGLLGGKSGGADSEGLDQQAEDAAFMAGRICGVGACGFTFTGYCQDPVLENLEDLGDVGVRPVCTDFQDTFYSQCSTESGVSSDPLADRFAEVITVYLPE